MELSATGARGTAAPGVALGVLDHGTRRRRGGGRRNRPGERDGCGRPRRCGLPVGQEPDPAGGHRRRRAPTGDAGDDPRVRGGKAGRSPPVQRCRPSGPRRLFRRVRSPALDAPHRSAASAGAGGDGRRHRQPAPRLALLGRQRDLDQLNKLLDSLWLVYDARGWYHATIDLTTDLLDILSSSPSTPERVAQEVTLRTSLARALMAIKGYTPEVEQAHTRALELFEGRQFPQLFPVLRSLASFYNFRAEFDKGAQVGGEILRLAEQQNDTSMLVDGHLVLGANLAFLNDLHAGLEHLDKAIGYFRSEPYRSRPFRLGNNPGVACFTTSAFVLWLLGYPDRALERANDAVALATELEHPFSLAYALFHSGFLHLWRRELDLVRDR